MLRIWNEITNCTDDVGTPAKLLTIYVSTDDNQLNVSKVIKDDGNYKEICDFIETGLDSMFSTILELNKTERDL